MGNDTKQTNEKNLILQIEDEIVVKFCEMNGGMEFAMPIIRKQYEKLNIDFTNPNKEDLYKIVDLLIEVTANIKGEDLAKKEKKAFIEILNKMEKELQTS